MIKHTLKVSLILAGLFLSNTLSAEKWDMPMAYSEMDFHSEIGAEFAAEVTTKSGGKLKITTHPNGSMFSGPEIYDAVRQGSAPIGERLISALSDDDPFYNLDSVPFLATTFDDARKLYEVSRPTLQKKLDASGLVFLYSIPWPSQGFYSVRDVRSKADIKGLKFRAYNAFTARIADLMGMVPTEIEAADLKKAFATGATQSMIASGTIVYDYELWDYIGYYYDIRAWLPRNMVFANKEAWSTLDGNTQAIILAAAQAAEDKGWQKSEALSDWYINQFKKKGILVNEIDSTLKADFVIAGEQLRDEWLESTNAEVQGIVKDYLNTPNLTRK